MSSFYDRHLVVRYKPSEKWVESYNNVLTKDEGDLPYFLQQKYPDVFSESWADLGKISIAPTQELFLDLLLECDSDYCLWSFHKNRKLTMLEYDTAIKIFNKMDINPSYDDLRMVEFCWDNCLEAEDYFDEPEDEFYNSKENLIMEVCNEINR